MNPTEIWPGPGETLEDLQRRGFRLIQKKQGYRFGLDAVLLAHFAQARRGDRVLDLCCGNGVVPVLLAARQEGLTLTGVEIVPETAQLARRNGRLNGLVFRVIAGDLCRLSQLLPGERFDLITANPPYLPLGRGKLPPDRERALARHEVACTLQDVVAAAAGALVPGGRFCLVYRAQRQTELLRALAEAGLVLGRFQQVLPRAGAPARLVLAEALNLAEGTARKLSPRELSPRELSPRELSPRELTPLILTDEAGQPSPALTRIYDA